MIAACLIREDAEGNSVTEKRLFGSMTRELHATGAVAVCSTGHGCGDGGDGHLLDAGLECTGTIRIAVAAHQSRALQAVRGKKTDLKDGTRIAELLQDGRLEGS